MFVAQRFVRWYAPDATGHLTSGEPPEADVLWSRASGEVIAIEVTDAPFDDDDAEQLWGSLRSRVPDADAFARTRPVGIAEAGFLTASSSHGLPELSIQVVTDPAALAARLSEVGRAHCESEYAPASKLILILNGGSRPLFRETDASVVASSVRLEDHGQYDEVFACVAVNDQFDRRFLPIR